MHVVTCSDRQSQRGQNDMPNELFDVRVPLLLTEADPGRETWCDAPPVALLEYAEKVSNSVTY